MTISGPTSALSSFLREHGITARIPTRWQRASRDQQNAAEETTEETNTTTAAGDGSLNENAVDETIAADETTVEPANVGRFTVNRRMTRSTTTKRKGGKRGKRAAGKKQQKKRKRDDCGEDEKSDYCGSDRASDDDSDSGSSSDDDGGIINNANTSLGKRQTDRQGGQTGSCGRCNAVFYYPSLQTEPPSLCPTCIKLSTVSQQSSSVGTGRKRRNVVKRPEDCVLVDNAAYAHCPSLHDLCINLISKYIDSVVSLGDLSDQSRDRLCLILAKHRQLNDQTIQLFFDPVSTHSLKLFDCARLTETGLESIAFFNQNLRELLMKECGRLSDTIVDRFTLNLTHLTSITLCGAYLVSDGAFAGLVDALVDQLTCFSVETCPKLGAQTLEALGKCRGLETLALRSCSAVRDNHLLSSGVLTDCPLVELDLSQSDGIGDFAFSGGLPVDTLRRICVDGCQRLTDKFLNQLRQIPSLEELSIEGVMPASARVADDSNEPTEVTSEGIGSLLADLPALKRLKCGQNLLLDCAQLSQMESHSLDTLNLNGSRQLVDTEQLNAIVERLQDAQLVDLSWIPAVNDEVLETVMGRCVDGAHVYVYGCTGLTDIAFEYWAKQRPSVKCYGSPFICISK